MESNAIELVCREVVELVTDYLGGTLPAHDRARFDAHLATCPPCTAYLAQVKTTLGQLGDTFRRWHAKREP